MRDDVRVGRELELAEDPREPFEGVAQEALVAAGVGAAVSGPAGALVGFAQPFLVRLAQLAHAEIKGADQRADAVYLIAQHDSGLEPEPFFERCAATSFTRQLVGTARDGAAGSPYPERIVALGKLLSEGVLSEDDDTLDNAQQMSDAVSSLERAHIRTMLLFIDGQHEREYGGWLRLTLTWEQLVDRGPALKKSLSRLLAVLEREGLVYRETVASLADDNGLPERDYTGAMWRITDFGIEALARLRQVGEGPNALVPPAPS